MIQWFWLNWNLICCFLVKYIMGNHSRIIKYCKQFLNMPLYRARTCFCLLLSHQWSNEKIFQLILYACERGIHTNSVWGQELFGGVPATNVLNICWHDSPLLDDTESFSSHRCLRVWQSNSGSTQGADHGQGSPESSQSEQQVKVKTDVVIELNNIESNLNR